MPNDLITQWLQARKSGDRMAMRRIENEAAEYDLHNPFGPRLADEIRGLRYPAAA
ncbi:hypothetical protein ACFCYX_19395 [Streptomyces populi]|uniref:hypothetical protein n=1 Tax=Streptomyces populi TaxID=2058924 RepID=UPI0035E15FB5